MNVKRKIKMYPSVYTCSHGSGGNVRSPVLSADEFLVHVCLMIIRTSFMLFWNIMYSQCNRHQR